MDHRLGDHLTLDLSGALDEGTARRNDLSGTVSDGTVFDNPLDQPVTIAAASGTSGDTLGAQVVVPVLANAAVVVAVGNGTATFVAINAEHAVGGIVRDDGELVLVCLQLEIAEARLAEGLLYLVEIICLLDKTCGGFHSWHGRGGRRGSGAQDSVQVTVTRLIELHCGL